MAQVACGKLNGGDEIEAYRHSNNSVPALDWDAMGRYFNVFARGFCMTQSPDMDSRNTELVQLYIHGTQKCLLIVA